MSNPYESPQRPLGVPAPSSIGSSVPLTVLAVLLAVTYVCAMVNTIEEGHPLSEGGMMLIMIAGISQLPGVLFAVWRWRTHSPVARPFVVGAFLIAITGAAAYIMYAFNGRADSMNSAAHMHVIAFPFMHCVFAVLVYMICAVAAAVASFLRRS